MPHSLEQWSFRLVVEKWGHLCCPVCGFEYNHISRVVVDQGNVRTICQSNGSSTVASDRHTRERGSLVVIEFACEAGHLHSLEFEFCKGMTSVKTALQGEYDNTFDEPPDELWRD